jgi:hypothetical protein
VEVRDDGPTVPQASYSYSEYRFAIRKSEKGEGKEQSTKSGPKPQTLAMASWLKFAIPKNEKDGGLRGKKSVNEGRTDSGVMNQKYCTLILKYTF